MAEINDGGHAFPPGIAVDHAGDTYHGPYGMSLRDWFAGQALVAMAQLTDPSPYEGRTAALISDLTVAAFGIADAMLVERKGDAP